MNAKADVPEFRLDPLKWALVALCIGGAVYANSYFSEQVALLYRVLGLIVVGVVAAFIAVNTAKGHSFWELVKAAQIELRKVVWPTRQETNQTTLLVLVVVFIAAIILWLLDSVFGKLASLIIG